MKNILLIFFASFTFCLYSQSVSVTYFETLAVPQQLLTSGIPLDKLQDIKAKMEAQSGSWTLCASNSSSVYEPVDKSDGSVTNSIFTDTDSLYLTFTSKKWLIYQAREKTSLSDWVISKTPQKDILSYPVYLATLKDNPETKAWFTPQIPVTSGPSIFRGLPGLVLKAKEGVATQVATKVEFFKAGSKGCSPSFSKAGKTVSQSEYSTYIRENGDELLAD